MFSQILSHLEHLHKSLSGSLEAALISYYWWEALIGKRIDLTIGD